MDKNVTPVRKQYLEIKQDYPEAILFFRLGDFYETFDEDAELVSRELDIVLTSRNIAKGQRIPMAGIPHHAADNYLSRLIERGYHVAICEQIGEEPVKGLFPREVVRVITPGTLIENELLPGDENNYLMGFVLDGGSIGVAYADVSTGEFAATQVDGADPFSVLLQEIERIQPAEILIPESFEADSFWEGNNTRVPDWRFELYRAIEVLQDRFRVATLDGFGIAGQDGATRAAGMIIDYLLHTQSTALNLLTGITYYSHSDYMHLDGSTRRNLEIMRTIRRGEVSGSLLGVLDKTVTPMGRRLMQQWVGKPLLDRDQITARQDLVSEFLENGVWREEFRASLKVIGDLERLTNRASVGASKPKELVGLRELLDHLTRVEPLLESRQHAGLQDLSRELDLCSDVRKMLEKAITEDPPATLGHVGVIQSGFSEELDRVVDDSREAREWISNLEESERLRTGIKSLKVGYNKVFGYYIEITNTHTDQVPAEYIRKQTLVNAERYITPEMKDYEARVLTAEERIRKMEQQIFKDVCERIGEQAERLLKTAMTIARLDVLSTLGEVAARNDYVRPVLVEEKVIEIREGRHPVVEELLGRHRFITNDTLLEDGEWIRIITGPNMSGKSTYLRQVALMILMAQMGSFVPASYARIGIADRIFTRIGAQDEIHAGQSTFMVEMVETANILHNATDRSLLILDEVGRGTSTYDGVAISWAVVEYIHNHPRLRARTFFATHYHELIRLSEVLPGVRNYNVSVAEEGGEVIFLHKIVPGGADRSYGIHVAELAGLPRPVINRAQEILAQFEASAGSAKQTMPTAKQMRLFPDETPLLDELEELDLNSLSPLEALNRLYEWQQKYAQPDQSQD
jgi:DNA mismatch repair protein MutS